MLKSINPRVGCRLSLIPFLAVLMLPMLASAASVTVPMSRITAEGTGESLGQIQFKEQDGHLLLLPALKGLSPGLHGFHIHENSSCLPMEKDGRMTAGLGAGAHYDPDQSGKHLGPEGQGHRGDLAALSVSGDGTAASGIIPVSRLSLSELHGHSVIIHADPDNYADQPGGARIGCGLIP